MFTNFNLRRGSAAVVVAIVLLALGSITGIIGGDDPPADAGNDVCKDIPYVRIDPDMSAYKTASGQLPIAFGSSIETRVADALTLTGVDQVKAVTADEFTVGCEYASQTLTQAIHRGIQSWPTSDQDWTDRLLKLDADREAQHELMGKVVKWQAEASAEVYYDPTPSYNSDWLERTGFGPMLRQGPGHDNAIGWVIKWTHEDGTVVIERLTCMYQWVGEIPPTVPPPGTPPVVTPPTTTVPPGTTVPTATTTPTNTTVPSGTTVPTTVVPTSTTIKCGDKADRLPDGSCGLTATTVPRAPATVPASSTTRPTTPPTAPSNTLAPGAPPTTWDNVPTATTVQPKDGPPVVGTPQTTVAPMVTSAPTTNVGTVCPPERQPCS